MVARGVPPSAFVTIGLASRLSGVSIEAIRAWERRYGAVSPQRAGRGRRLYRQADVSRLRLLRRAIERGHSIGAIHGLPDEELRSAAGVEPSRAATPTQLDEILAAASRLDVSPLAATPELPHRDWALGFAGPLLDRARRELPPAPLHLINHEVAAIAAARRREIGGARGPAIVVGGGADEARLGLASLLAADAGARAVHLGRDAEPGALAEAAMESGAAAVVTAHRARDLSRLLPPQIELWVLDDPAPPEGIALESLDALAAELPRLLP